MIDYFKMAVMEKYAQFDGRSTRSEYWYFVLAYLLMFIVASVVLGFLTYATGGSGVMGWILIGVLVLGGLALIVPSIAISIRRLHDIGKSGWWYLLAFIPFGSLILLIFMCLESQPGTNQYGPNPFELSSGDDISGHLVQDDLV